MKLAKNPPSQERQDVQMVLNQAIAATLKRKCRFGQYSVFWEDDKVVYRGDDTPQPTQKHD
ncbi:hypothetical protein [Methylomonas sp. MgM2]